MNIKGFTLQNEEKVVRAAEGAATADGGTTGGVGYDDKDLLLAAYDKLGGLILEDGNKVKTGSFWDFKGNKPLSTPKVIYLVKVDGVEVEVPKGQKMPMEVEARKIIDAQKKSKKVASKKETSTTKADSIEE